MDSLKNIGFTSLQSLQILVSLLGAFKLAENMTIKVLYLIFNFWKQQYNVIKNTWIERFVLFICLNEVLIFIASRGVLGKRCSENMHQIYRRTQMPKCDFNKVALQLLQPSRGVLKKSCSENMQQIYRTTPMLKCDFNKIAKQLYWNSISIWVLSCKFAAYFQNTFPKEPLWGAVSVYIASHR